MHRTTISLGFYFIISIIEARRDNVPVHSANMIHALRVSRWATDSQGPRKGGWVELKLLFAVSILVIKFGHRENHPQRPFGRKSSGDLSCFHTVSFGILAPPASTSLRESPRYQLALALSLLLARSLALHPVRPRALGRRDDTGKKSPRRAR